MPREVGWDRLDKARFLGTGVGVFSAVTTALFPLTVVKTRMMAIESAHGHGMAGLVGNVRDIVRSEGAAGLYRGYSTVVLGIIPARVLYLSTLELVKSAAERGLGEGGLGLDERSRLAGANFLGGGTASLITQTVVSPVDVVSQRQMIAATRRGPLEQLRVIWAQEGLRGLYRGYWASLALVVPASATWWGAYGFYQPRVWAALEFASGVRPGARGGAAGGGGGAAGGVGAAPGAGGHGGEHSNGTIMGVQTVAGLMAGVTSGALTTPLDVVKTRLQTLPLRPDGSRPNLADVVGGLYREEGPAGFLRGIGPRITNVALWGTCMVVVYEGLKRASVKDQQEE